MTYQSKEQALMQMGVLHHDCHPACEECRFNSVTGAVRFPGGIEDIDSRCTGLPHECAALRETQDAIGEVVARVVHRSQSEGRA